MRVEARAGGGFVVVAAPVNPNGVVVLSDAFASGRDEAFHGFGGRHNSLDQRGHALYAWAEQENDEGVMQNDASTDMGPNGPTAAYYSQAQFISSRPYGFVVDQPEKSAFRLAADRPDAWQVSAAAPTLRYVVAPGDGRRAIGVVTQISGRQRPAPLWALGAIESQVDGVRSAATDAPQGAADNPASVALYAPNSASGAQPPNGSSTLKLSVEHDLARIDALKVPLTAFESLPVERTVVMTLDGTAVPTRSVRRL